MAIIISQKGKKTQKVDKLDFEKEGNLQSYIHENPESIPVYEIEESKRLFVVAREFRTESGPIDALAVDKDGDIYVVETKLYKNSDKRTVVAQALDYGASLWRHSDYGEFINLLNSEISKKFKVSFEEKVKDFFKIDEEQTGILLEAIRTNLQHGNIRFVILMDAVDDRLKDLIVYINQNSQFDIYAVQMEYYKFESYEIMIPKLFGVEVKKSMTSNSTGSPRRKWDEQGFFEEVKKIFSKSDFESISKLYTFSKELADEIHWGTGVNQSSFSVGFKKLGNRPLFVLLSDGRMKISTEYPKRGATKEQVSNLDQLNLALKKIGLEVNPKSERTVFTLPEWSIKLGELIKAIKGKIR